MTRWIGRAGLGVALAAVAAAAAACGDPTPAGAETGDSTGSETSSGTGETGETGESGESGSSTTGEDNAECSMYAQDCGPGEKCNWKVVGTDVTQVCVPIMGAQEIGEVCWHEGIFSGVDDCDATALCYGAVSLNSGWEGVCRSYCGGNEDAPICSEADYACTRGNLPACLPTCDPLLQDCPGTGEICFWQEPIPGFVCALGSEATEIGEPCLVPFECRKGNTCQPGAKVAGCASSECCTEFCDTTAANTCSAKGQGAQCLSLGVGGLYADVGACLVP